MNSLLNRWKAGLERSSKAVFGQIASLLGTSEINENTWNELESLLIRADLGVETCQDIIKDLQDFTRKEGLTQAHALKEALHAELLSRLIPPPALEFSAFLTVVLIVGVNGSGKTTTIAKLGKRFSLQGKQVLLGAADTFRAGAVDQLQVWAERVHLPVIFGQPGADPGAVAYDTIHSALSRKIDVVIIDTAGRLHTRYNLMEELKKVHRVVGKALPGAPQHCWLVIDATTGQNALTQARAFKEAIHIDGVILAKLDSSARGGMAFAIQHSLGLPILFAGLGEGMEDLQPFDPQAFVNGILAEDDGNNKRMSG